MAFYGYSFVFDGVSSEEFGLIIASIDGNGQQDGSVGGHVEIQETRTNSRATPLHYGVVANKPLSFPVTFTVSEDNTYLDRFDVAKISAWLTGHSQYKTLVLCQPDMENVCYKCIITELTEHQVGGQVVGFTAVVTCDAPYAYRVLADTPYTVSTQSQIVYRNLSNVNDYYKPEIVIVTSSQDITIENVTDGTVFALSGMPKKSRVITIDCLNYVMTSDDDINLYAYWDLDKGRVFPRFSRGENTIVIAMDSGTVTIKNEFPWSIGF